MPKPYYLPAAAASAVASFTPIGSKGKRLGTEGILAVEYLNYGIIGGIQITSFSDSQITVTGVLINNEFHASLHAPCEEPRGVYLQKGFPRRLNGFGDSFITITNAPAAPEPIRKLCYEHPVREVAVYTDHGDFKFRINAG